VDLALRRVRTGTRLHLVVDSTGLSIVGEGEWAAAKHGGRGKRGWKKLHLGVDRSGHIIAHALTDAIVDDALTGIALTEGITGAVASLTADAAYDTIAFYAVAAARGARVVVPPAKTATALGRGPRSRARDRTIRMVTKIGRRQWKKASGYHRQARAENAFFRYKSIFGGALRARSPGGQVAETLVACNALNQMTDLGRPDSYAIGR
jgi:Transposase DDE domain